MIVNSKDETFYEALDRTSVYVGVKPQNKAIDHKKRKYEQRKQHFEQNLGKLIKKCNGENFVIRQDHINFLNRHRKTIYQSSLPLADKVFVAIYSGSFV